MGKRYNAFMKLIDNGANCKAFWKVDEAFEQAFGDEAHWDGLAGLVKDFDRKIEAPVCKITYNAEANEIEFRTRSADEEEYGLSKGLLLNECKDPKFASVWVLRNIFEFDYYGYRIIIDIDSLPTFD